MLGIVRSRVLCLLLLPAIAAAQPNDAGIAAKLASDLLALKLAVASDEPLKDDPYTPVELQSVETYSQSQAMKSFTKDLGMFRFQAYFAHSKPVMGPIAIKPFIGPDQAYKLAFVLTGKDLPEASLRPLAEGLLNMLESIDACMERRSPLENSEEFRSSAEKTRDALQTLGVGRRDVHIVMDSLFRGAITAVVPPPRLTYQ